MLRAVLYTVRVNWLVNLLSGISVFSCKERKMVSEDQVNKPACFFETFWLCQFGGVEKPPKSFCQIRTCSLITLGSSE